MSRLPVSRLARIGAWTGAAVAWGVTAVVAREAAPLDAAEAAPEPQPDEAALNTTIAAAVPEMPGKGLVVLRYSPIPDPEPKVITRYVTVTVPVAGSAPAPTQISTGGASGGGSSTPPAGTVTAPPPPPPPPTPTPTTAPPAPSTGGS